MRLLISIGYYLAIMNWKLERKLLDENYSLNVNNLVQIAWIISTAPTVSKKTKAFHG
jgi:hypothetical protein